MVNVRRMLEVAPIQPHSDPDHQMETSMFRPTRRAVAALIAGTVFAPGAAFAADAPKQIAIDWATYNPVSIILKEKGLLEKEFEKDSVDPIRLKCEFVDPIYHIDI